MADAALERGPEVSTAADGHAPTRRRHGDAVRQCQLWRNPARRGPADGDAVFVQSGHGDVADAAAVVRERREREGGGGGEDMCERVFIRKAFWKFLYNKYKKIYKIVDRLS